MLRTPILLLLALLCSSYLFANGNDADSLQITELLNKAKDISKRDISESYRYLNMAKDIARKNKSNKYYARILYNESEYLYQDGKLAEMIDTCILAASLFKRENLPLEEAKSYSRAGVAAASQNLYKMALDYFFQSLELSENLKDRKALGAVYLNIGNVYDNLKDWENALEYSFKSLEIRRETNDSSGMASCYGTIGNIYYTKKDYAESIKYFKMGSEIEHLLGANNYSRLAIRSANIANAFMESGQLDSSILHNERALKYLEMNVSRRLRVWCQVITNLSDAWLRKGNIQKSSYYLKECEPCESAVSDVTYLANLYPLKARYYKETGDYKKSIKYLEMAANVKDSILMHAQNLEYQKMGIRYEFDQKAREDSLKYQLNLSEQRNATATYKNRMYLMLIVGMLILFSAIIIISRLRIEQKVKRTRELEKVRLGIAGDLHDDIGSTISSIQIISSMLGMQNESNPKIREAAENINRLSNKVAGGIREVVWSLNPENDSMGAIVSQMHKMASDILSTSNIPFAFAKNLSDPKRKLSPQLRKDFMLIFKEAVNNARKYSKATQVDIHVDQRDDMLILKIKDYGCGFDAETVAMGNGLHNMKRRAENMNGRIEINSQKGSGTIILLEVSLVGAGVK
ncbi:MAG TPA: tetratricopeptide repeat protein [Ginsengibacter sp.]|nr:tetratricopeptide repeat protein [Ginsengibacter sp.]